MGFNDIKNFLLGQPQNTLEGADKSLNAFEKALLHVRINRVPSCEKGLIISMDRKGRVYIDYEGLTDKDALKMLLRALAWAMWEGTKDD